MFKGFYAAAAGMVAGQRRQEMLTNNMANANTPGFKADQASVRAFPEMLISRINNTSLPNNRKIGTVSQVGYVNTGAYMQEAAANFRMGTLQQTSNKTDIALLERNVPVDPETNTRGTLLFEVQNAAGEPRYTRNGSLAVDPEGFLTTTDGFHLLNTEGNPIRVNGEEFTVLENGQVQVNGAVVATINVAFAANPYTLIREGTGLFALPENGELPTAIGNPNVDFSLRQGFLEGSNVDVDRTMTDMLMAFRNFEANQKVLKAYDETMEKAVNQIGRIG